jgi:polyisoprenoid-binding protein YceI
MKRALPFLLAAVVAGSLALPAPEGAAKEAATDPAALEGGNPIPDGPAKATFPFFAKQSITFTSDAPAERMVGLVAFENPGAQALGSAESDGKGGGSFSFKVPVSALTTGSKSRDEHMAGEMWLDAGKHPEISFVSKKVERVRPTVWRVTGTWTMHGVSKDLTMLANVRHIGKIERVGDSVLRVRAEFPLSLKEFGVANQYVGSPAVAESWDVSVDLLGVMGGGR